MYFFLMLLCRFLQFSSILYILSLMDRGRFCWHSRLEIQFDLEILDANFGHTLGVHDYILEAFESKKWKITIRSTRGCHLMARSGRLHCFIEPCLASITLSCSAQLGGVALPVERSNFSSFWRTFHQTFFIL